MITRETNKLFYNEYLYKITFQSVLTRLLRSRNLSYIDSELNELQEKFTNNNLFVSYHLRFRSAISISLLDLKDAQLFHKFVKANKDLCKTRFEGSVISVYSNDKKKLLNLLNKINCSDSKEFFSPDLKNINLLTRKSNVILVNNPPEFEYKVTLGTQKDYSFIKWINNNPNKAKASDALNYYASKQGEVSGMYFYVKDEKILQLIQLLGIKIRRIDNLIYKEDIDKYMYGSE